MMQYSDNFDFKPFVITQIHEKQNEFILTPESLIREKDEFSWHIYSRLESTRTKETFLRLFYYKKHIVLCYYWATNVLEEQTNRDGLYVICGMLTDERVFRRNAYLLSYYFCRFVEQLSKETNSEIHEICSDNCFNALQDNTEKRAEEIFRSYSGFITSSKRRGTAIRWRPRIWNATANLTIIQLVDSFYDKIKIFVYESQDIYKKTNCLDVSTNPKISPYHIQFMKNGDVLPVEISKIQVSEHDGIKYIKAI